MSSVNKCLALSPPKKQAFPELSPTSAMNALYKQPLPARRSGPLFNAFSYSTKIDPEVIAVYIAAHTKPGQTVLDPFGGSGTTGIATKLCGRPTERMKKMAADIGEPISWGPRKAYVWELSSVGSFAGRIMSNPPSPAKFKKAAQKMIGAAEQFLGSLYEARGPSGETGRLRYIIWSEVLETPCCHTHISLYDATVELAPAKMRHRFSCPKCDAEVEVKECARVTDEAIDHSTGKKHTKRRRVMARIYGKTHKKTWSRAPIDHDSEIVNRVSNTPREWYPTETIEWGDLYRTGYHTGIDRFHHFYTPRNLQVLAHLWSLAESEKDTEIQEALKLLVLSYNASHSTLLSRVVVKSNQKDLVVTGAQSGVLYVSGLPIEKNILDGLRRKIKTFSDAFALTRESDSIVEVVCGSSTHLTLKDNSVDYVFTDPPFGGYIPYAEINQINESWLGVLTKRSEETIISPAQNKNAADYAQLMATIFSEVGRVLKPQGNATVVFHASKPCVWEALGNAFRANGFSVKATSILDKEQISFKQAVSKGGTRHDAIFLLEGDSKPRMGDAPKRKIENIIEEIEAQCMDKTTELTPRRIWSRYVAQCVQEQTAVGLTAPEFYAMLDGRRNSNYQGDLENAS